MASNWKQLHRTLSDKSGSIAPFWNNANNSMSFVGILFTGVAAYSSVGIMVLHNQLHPLENMLNDIKLQMREDKKELKEKMNVQMKDLEKKFDKLDAKVDMT